VSEDGSSNGLSGWAGLALGRMWTEHDRSTEESIAWFANRRRRNVDAASLATQIQALAAENAQLRQELADYRLNYRNLKSWANRAEAQIDQLLKDRGG
jgi:hypothetical protein